MKKNAFNLTRKVMLGAALLALPALAFAGNGPYIGLEGGANWLNPEDFQNGGAREFHADYNSGYVIGVTAGYSFASGFRPEFELDYRRNSLDSISGTLSRGLLGNLLAGLLGASGTFDLNASGREEAYTAMGNLWYDFTRPSGFFSVVHPYLGGGIGFARVGIRHATAASPALGADDINEYQSAFVYQGGAGVAVDITRRLTASVDWRWLQTNRLGFNSVSAGPVNARYRSQSAMLGVRYSFGTEPKPVPPPPPPPAKVVPAPPPPPAKPACNPPAGFKVDENCKIIPQKITLRSVNFKFDKATLTDAAKQTLDNVAAALKQQPDLNVDIDGYTDSTGPAAYNKRLSQQRADSVRSYLISDGVNASTLHAQGHGEADPVASNKTRAGRTLNRRVEFTVSNAPAHVEVIKKKPTSASIDAAAPK